MGEQKYKVIKQDTKKLNTLHDFMQMLDKKDPERKKWIQIEFQELNEGIMRETYRQIKAQRREKSVIWGCDNEPIKIAEGEIPRFASDKEVKKLYLLYFTGLLPFTNISF
jgi:hypothetical protein